MAHPAAPLLATLDQLAGVVATLPPRDYGSRIGPHVRHSLDHVEALLSVGPDGIVDYDARRRGTDDERTPGAALDRVRRLASRLRDLPEEALSRAIRVRGVPAADEPPVTVASTLARELVYVASHTTHHNAIIGLLVRSLGGSVPERFGYAPSTLAWLAESPCAR